jgi:hypothetical protein
MRDWDLPQKNHIQNFLTQKFLWHVKERGL